MAKCMFPFYAERNVYFNQEDRFAPVPCGKCPECLKRRVASWSHRLEMESLRWQRQFFVTLTYNTDNVPISSNGFLTLEPDHPKNFFKRLRKSVGKCRYYLAGEYGTQKKRPHYHIILFGTDVMTEQHIIDAWTIPHSSPRRSYGDVYFGKVEAASIRYTVQYYDKGDWQPAHKRDDRIPEFSRMSNGIGQNFLTPKMVQHFLDNPEKSYIYDREGRKIAIPRYYKRRIYDYVSNSNYIAHNPSILLHRDEMLLKKEIHHEKIAEKMEMVEDPDALRDPYELHQARQAAIINYRSEKRKTRK